MALRDAAHCPRIFFALLLLLIKQDALRGAFQVLILAGAERPEEEGQGAGAERQADRDQVGHDVHGGQSLGLRKLLASTMIELLDMAAAASQGVTRPITAAGRNSAL